MEIDFLPINPELLLKEELTFELRIRALDIHGVVLVLKGRLAKAIKGGIPISDPVFENYDPQSEVQILVDGLSTLKNLVKR